MTENDFRGKIKRYLEESKDKKTVTANNKKAKVSLVSKSQSTNVPQTKTQPGPSEIRNIQVNET